MNHRLALVALALVWASTSCLVTGPGDGRVEPPRPADAPAFVQAMGVGWNLGNTLECVGDWINKSSISNFETAWGNPRTTRAMIHALKLAGVGSVRIPVAWSNLMGDDFTIEGDLLDRVDEVAGWVIDEGMVAVVNLHWDGGWMSGFSTNWSGTMAKYRRIWEQVSARMASRGEALVFESLNEEAYFNDVSAATAYDLVRRVNQAFVDLIRGAGGQNPTRYLLIAGYATDIDKTVDPRYVLPTDPQNRLIVSVHYYTPSTFTILEDDADWGRAAATWGTEAEVAQVATDFAKLQRRFLAVGVPVILGEYGTTLKYKTGTKDLASVRLYLKTVAQTAWDLGICPMLWDPGTHFNRSTKAFRDPEVAQILADLGARPRALGR